jgi:glutathione S-transferase
VNHRRDPTGLAAVDKTAPMPSAPPDRIIHIALPDDWATARTAGAYTVSTRGVSLDEEGFIHCSLALQVEATANSYYGDLEELVLLHIDTSKVPAPIEMEPPFPGSPDVFPHIYGPLPVAAVVQATPWRRADGERWTYDADP